MTVFVTEQVWRRWTACADSVLNLIGLWRLPVAATLTHLFRPSFRLCTGNGFCDRTSVAALESLRDSVLDLIGRARVNKTTVMRSLVRRPRPRVDELLYSEGEEPDTPYHRQLRR
jgi:hypothetical protein